MRNTVNLLTIAVLVGGQAVCRAQSDAPSRIRQQSDAADRALERELKPIADALDAARKLFQAGDFKGAEAGCIKARQLIDASPHRGAMRDSIAAMLGRTYLAEGRDREALAVILQGGPQHQASMMLEASIVYCRLGNYREALRWYQAALPAWAPKVEYEAVAPDDLPGTGDVRSLEATSLSLDSNVSDSAGLNDFALSELQQAHELSPFSAYVRFRLAESHMRRASSADTTAEKGLPDAQAALRYAQGAAEFGHGNLKRLAKGIVSGAHDRIAAFERVLAQPSNKP